MTKYNTGNPVGSADPRDLHDNAQVFDEQINNVSSPTVNDRFGRARVTLANQLGYNFKRDYSAGITLNNYNDYIRYDGEFYGPSASATLPYTTTATLPDADSNLVGRGDAVLRQELSGSPADGLGAAMVNGSVIRVSSVAENLEGATASGGAQYSASGWESGSIKGGAKYTSDSAGDRTSHNGTTTISPTVPPVSSQAGATLNEKKANFLIGTGETAPSTPGSFEYVQQLPYASFKTVNTIAAASERPREVRTKDGKLFVMNQALTGGGSTQPTFQIFDIEATGLPVLIETINVGSVGDDIRAFDLQDHLAYIVTFGKGSGLNEMYIYDLINPDAPVLLSTTNIGGGSHSIRVSGGIAYIGEYQGGALGVWDVSIPASPRRISQTALGELSVIGNALAGDYWYTVTNTSPAKFITVNVSDPSAPSVTSTINLTGTSARHVDVDGNFAYVVCIASQTLDIVDLSDSSAPSVVSSTSVPFDAGNLSWVKVIGNKCFTGGENLTVFDVTDKSAPEIEAVSKNLALSFDFWKGKAYCADYVDSNIVTLQMMDSYFDLVMTPEVQALRARVGSVEVREGLRARSSTVKDAIVRDSLNVGNLNIRNQSSVEADQCTQSFPSGGGLTKLIFDREVTDVLGEYDLASGDFVAARNGKYMLNCAVAVNNPPDGNTLNLVVYRGGTLYRFIGLEHAGAGESMQIQGSLIVDLEKGQSLDVRLGSDAAVSAILSMPERYSYFSIVKIQ